MYIDRHRYAYIYICVYVSTHRFVIAEMHVHIGCTNMHIDANTGVSIMHEYIHTRLCLRMHSKYSQIYKLLHI